MKLVGIVGRAYYNKDNQEIFQIHEGSRKCLLPYEDVVVTGLLPFNNIDYINLNYGEDEISEIDKKKLDFMLDKCDGFIVPGGTYTYKFDEYVIEHAIKNDKPLLCICAGFQALCAYDTVNRISFSMLNKIENNTIHHKKRDEYAHEIAIKKDSLLYEIIGRETILVNSIHNEYYNGELKTLIPCAESSDGILEAVYMKNKKCILGVEWHPEVLIDENSKKIFDYFVSKL